MSGTPFRSEAEWKAAYRNHMVRCLTGAPAWRKDEAEKYAAYSADAVWEFNQTEDPDDSAQAEFEAMCDG